MLCRHTLVLLARCSKSLPRRSAEAATKYANTGPTMFSASQTFEETLGAPRSKEADWKGGEVGPQPAWPTILHSNAAKPPRVGFRWKSPKTRSHTRLVARHRQTWPIWAKHGPSSTKLGRLWPEFGRNRSSTAESGRNGPNLAGRLAEIAPKCLGKDTLSNVSVCPSEGGGECFDNSSSRLFERARESSRASERGSLLFPITTLALALLLINLGVEVADERILKGVLLLLQPAGEGTSSVRCCSQLPLHRGNAHVCRSGRTDERRERGCTATACGERSWDIGRPQGPPGMGTSPSETRPGF